MDSFVVRDQLVTQWEMIGCRYVSEPVWVRYGLIVDVQLLFCSVLDGTTFSRTEKYPSVSVIVHVWSAKQTGWGADFHKRLFSAGKPKVRLTSDSPALNGSCITFTAKLEYPPCQKEDANGDLVWDDHCEDGTDLEASGAA